MSTCFLPEYFLLQHNYRHVSQITTTRVLSFVLFSFLPSQKINLFSTEFNKDWTKIYYFFYCFPIGQNWTIGQSIFWTKVFNCSSPKTTISRDKDDATRTSNIVKVKAAFASRHPFKASWFFWIQKPYFTFEKTRIDTIASNKKIN